MPWNDLDAPHSLRGPHYRQGLPQVTLEILRGNANRKLRHVHSPVFLIGSAADCDLVLGDPLFPAVHTYLYVRKDGVSVRHIGAGPDLCVNGQRVETFAVHSGDVLGLGAFEFLLHVHGRTGTDDDERPRWERTDDGAEAEAQWDPEWAQTQLLLCDLPAPLRPFLPSAHPFPRRASA